MQALWQYAILCSLCFRQLITAFSWKQDLYYKISMFFKDEHVPGV